MDSETLLKMTILVMLIFIDHLLVRDPFLNTFHKLAHLIFTADLWGRKYYLQETDA